MSKEIISNRQAFFIILMHFVGSLVFIGTSISAKQNVWISIILSLVLSIPMLYIYSKLLMLYPGKNFVDISIEIFGNVAGSIISLPFIWYTFHLGLLVIRNFSEYINVVSLPETPQFVSIYFMGLLVMWMCKAGIEVLGRWVTFSFPIILFVLLFGIILSLTKANLINLKPIMYDGIKPVLNTTFAFISFPILETVIFTMLLDNIKEKNKTFKLFLNSVIVGCIIMLLVLVRNVLVLGADNVNQVYFPSMLAVKTIDIGLIVQRIEIVVSIVFIFGAFVKITTCAMATTIGLTTILKIDSYRKLVIPVCVTMMTCSTFFNDNIIEMIEWSSNVYQYYAIPFQFILPTFLLIAGKIKIKVQNKKQKALTSK